MDPKRILQNVGRVYCSTHRALHSTSRGELRLSAEYPGFTGPKGFRRQSPPRTGSSNSQLSAYFGRFKIVLK